MAALTFSQDFAQGGWPSPGLFGRQQEQADLREEEDQQKPHEDGRDEGQHPARDLFDGQARYAAGDEEVDAFISITPDITPQVIRELRAAGLGVAILNIRPPNDTTYSGLSVACRPIADTGDSPNIILAIRSGGWISRRSMAFSDHCRRFFRTEAAEALFVR